MQCLDCGPNAFLMSLFIKYYLNLKFSPFKIALIEEPEWREIYSCVVTDHVESQLAEVSVMQARLSDCQSVIISITNEFIPPVCLLSAS